MGSWKRSIVTYSLLLLVSGITPPSTFAEGPAFRTVHLMNLRSEADEAAVLSALSRLNQVAIKEGYPQVRFRLWKVDGIQQGDFSYLLESTWPDRLVYRKVHDSESYREAVEANRAVEEAIKGEVYNRYVELLPLDKK